MDLKRVRLHALKECLNTLEALHLGVSCFPTKEECKEHNAAVTDVKLLVKKLMEEVVASGEVIVE